MISQLDRAMEKISSDATKETEGHSVHSLMSKSYCNNYERLHLK